MITQSRSAENTTTVDHAAAVRAAWIHRPAVDVLIALCWVPFALVAHRLEPSRGSLDLFVTGVFLLSFAHQPLTIALVYGDTEQFRLRRAIFTWSPLVFAVAVLVASNVSVVLLAVAGGLWNAEHTLMQRYGITRIYGRKVSQHDGLVEKLLLFSWLGIGLVWVAADAQTPDRLATVSLGDNNSRGVELLASLRPVAGWLVLPVVLVSMGLLVRWLFDERRTVNAGGTVNPVKWLYLGSTAVLFVVILIDPIAGIMGYVGAHAVEYFAIVHQSLGRRYGDPVTGGRSPLGRAVRARPGRLGFFAIYLGIVTGIVSLLEWRGSPVLYAVVFFTLGGLHVFYDGFIWKLRRPKVAASLAIPPS
ncbi:MAG: hypothetical protein HYX32_06455 [Actinobacteria bacterium]|nr:hypothetical protein [Actinomycetota bacterium]